MKRRALFSVATALVAAGFTFACSLRDTGYLNSGEGTPDGGGGDDVVVNPDVVDPNPGTRTSTTVVPNQVGPRNLAQDDTSLYWVTNDGNLLAWKKDGSDAMPRVIAPIGGATFLVAEQGAGPSIFYAAGNKVFRVAKAGGAPAEIFTTDPPPHALTVDETYVFVVGDGDLSDQLAGLHRLLHDGGSQAVLHEAENGYIHAVASHGNDVFWDEGDEVFLSLPKTAVPDAGPTKYIPTGGAGTVVLTPAAFLVDDQAIYFSDENGDVRSMRRQPSASPALLLVTASEVRAIATDDRYVYGLETGADGALRRNTKDGIGTTELMLAKLPMPSGLVVDATTVYIAVEGPPGAIIKCLK